MKNEDIKLLLDTQFTSVRGMLMAFEENTNKRFDTVDESNKIRNKRLEKAEDKIIALEKRDIAFEQHQANCPATKIVDKLNKKWFWIGAALIVIVVYITLRTIYDTIGFGELFYKMIS
jgi:Tfp pilus assembly protein FimT